MTMHHRRSRRTLAHAADRAGPGQSWTTACRAHPGWQAGCGWGLFCYRFTLKPDQRVWQRLGRCAPLTALLLSALCSMTYAPGVEVFTDFADRGEVRHRSTPSGDTTATAHYGEYSDLAAYAALEQWCPDN